MATVTVRYAGVGACATTAAPAACALASGVVTVTFGLGAAGAGVITPAMVAVSWLAPVSMVSLSPAARPVVLASRIAVAPAADAAFSVVFAGAGAGPEETLPAA